MPMWDLIELQAADAHEPKGGARIEDVIAIYGAKARYTCSISFMASIAGFFQASSTWTWSMPSPHDWAGVEWAKHALSCAMLALECREICIISILRYSNRNRRHCLSGGKRTLSRDLLEKALHCTYVPTVIDALSRGRLRFQDRVLFVVSKAFLPYTPTTRFVDGLMVYRWGC